MVSPVFVPAVCHKPIRGSVLSAPSHDLDGMSSKHRILEEKTCLVNAGLVGKEALMDKEHTGDGTILINLLHHGVRALAVTLLAHAVATSAVVLAGSPVSPVVDALASTLRGGLAGCAVGVFGRGAVMGARLQLIRVAHGLVSIVATIHNAKVLVVAVDGGGNASVAAHITQVVTRGHILS